MVEETRVSISDVNVYVNECVGVCVLVVVVVRLSAIIDLLRVVLFLIFAVFGLSYLIYIFF